MKILFEFFKESVATQIFGLGIDALTKDHYPYSFMKKDPHNDFIKVFIEFGYLGITLFMAFLGGLFFLVKRNLNLLILLGVPLFFDNTLVNFSTILLFTVLVAYEYKHVIHTRD